MTLSSDENMVRCRQLRNQGLTWNQVADRMGLKSSKSLSTTYSRWLKTNNVVPEMVQQNNVREMDCDELVNMLTDAFKQVNITASFKMDTPKLFVETFKLLVEEIRLTRLSIDKLLELGKTIQDIDRDTKIMLDNNLPLNRRRR